jgi:hypothetical protein
MRRLAVVALLLGIALPVCAQHGGSHGGGGGGFHGGGFSSHSAPSFHGGFSSSAPSRFAGGSRPVAPRSFAPRQFAPRYGASSGLTANRMRSFSPAYGMRSGAGRDYARPAYDRDRDGHHPRRPYRPIYRSGFVYGVPQYPGWIGPEYFDYPDDYGYDDGSSYTPDSGYAGNGGYVQPDDQGPPPPYEPPAEPAQPSAASAPAPENTEAITLVFRDGRASEQIHNYILSRTTLSVLDGHHRDIPVDQLDLAATEKANRDAGVDFRLPDTLR